MVAPLPPLIRPASTPPSPQYVAAPTPLDRLAVSQGNSRAASPAPLPLPQSPGGVEAAAAAEMPNSPPHAALAESYGNKTAHLMVLQDLFCHGNVRVPP